MKSSFLSKVKTIVKERVNGLSAQESKIFVILVVICVGGFAGFINYMSNSFSIQMPATGGTLREGILGTPRFINPVLATSDIDQDLTKLVYSGLVRTISSGGEVTTVPDLAESYTVSPDGKIYTFILRKDAQFHDRKPVTAHDVVFTVKTIQDPQFQSPEFNNWLGITAEALDPQTVQITLSRPFSGFLKTASIGILPNHIWGTLTPDEFLASNQNNVPVGSGPYRIKRISRDKNGIPVSYTFKSFNKFVLGKPYISRLVITLFPNEQALLNNYRKGEYTALANIRPYEITKENTRFTATTALPRMFGLFLNPERSEFLRDAELRRTIEDTINQTEIITTVFQGFAHPIDHPIPEIENKGARKTIDTEIVKARLDTLGWTINPETGIRTKAGKQLSFIISTADTAELKYTAQIIQKQLKDVGIGTELQIFQLSDLENSVIKERSFQILLFGQLIRDDADLYAFWHSTQVSDPGLNITKFSSRALDESLEKLFITNDSDARRPILETINQQLSGAPVIWLYQPDFIYALRRPVYGIELHSLISKNDRFSNIHQWYLETDTVWKFFNK